MPRGTQEQSLSCLLSSTGLSPSLAGLSRAVRLRVYNFPLCPTTPDCMQPGLGCFPFARHYSGNRFFSSGYLDVSVPRVPFLQLCVHHRIRGHAPTWVSPFGHLRLNRLHTPHQSFSQCTTSFFGIWHQGIHRTPLVAYPTCDAEKLIFSRYFLAYAIGNVRWLT